jgi:hypothetical protein
MAKKYYILSSSDWERVQNDAMIALRKRVKFSVTLDSDINEKTLDQLGYLHSTVLPHLVECLYESGEIKDRSETAAKMWLKVSIHFGEWVDYRIGDIPQYSFVPQTFAKASVNMLKYAIEHAIDYCANCGVVVPEPRRTDQGDDSKPNYSALVDDQKRGS